MSVKLVNNGMTASLRRIQSELDRLPQQAYDFWVKATPKDTGNARRLTALKKNEIQANYAYAQRLDEGWSKQAPNGMSQPTEQFIKQRTDKILRK
jgi:uncharacterized damage-inducible protein DinB